MLNTVTLNMCFKSHALFPIHPAYLKEIKTLTSWCNDNSLELNIAKTKELAIDFRRDKQRLTEHPWCTGGDSEPLKYLGVVISEDLS